MKRRIVLACFSLLLPAALFGQSVFLDPGIPDNESLVYTATRDKETYRLTQRTRKGSVDGRPVYEVSIESPRENSTVTLAAGTMGVLRSWARRIHPDLVTETETKILKNEIRDKPGEATLVDFNGLTAILRGFPFGVVSSIKLKTGQESGFALTLAQTRETDIKTAAGVIRCCELELGMEGFFGAFMPKTRFWYEKASPHRLVRYEGNTGGPGSPRYIIELAGSGAN
ncbi:MAG: hypothetical protein JXD23_17885 [Spirochaetales bacterium]|nr:hypothetical protein [Spirochaetales bacterium]